MAHLTEINKFGIPQPKALENEICGKWAYENCDGACDIACPLGDCFSKLADYEDAEEQGRLFISPCKVGEKIFLINERKKTIREYRVTGFSLLQKAKELDVHVEPEDYPNESFPIFMFGKSVFLTMEEAEAKLAELED